MFKDVADDNDSAIARSRCRVGGQRWNVGWHVARQWQPPTRERALGSERQEALLSDLAEHDGIWAVEWLHAFVHDFCGAIGLSGSKEAERVTSMALSTCRVCVQWRNVPMTSWRPEFCGCDNAGQLLVFFVANCCRALQ